MAQEWRWEVVMLVGLIAMRHVESLRFDIEQKECWVHEVPLDGELVHVSFTVFKINQWAYRHTGVDLVVRGSPSPFFGHHVHVYSMLNLMASRLYSWNILW